MKKETMYILGGVAVVGLAYYLYNRNQQSTTPFANATGIAPKKIGDITLRGATGNGACGGCPEGSQCYEVIFPNGYRGYRCINTTTWTVVNK